MINVEALAKRITLGYPFQAWGPKIAVVRLQPYMAVIQVSLRDTPHRDTGLRGQGIVYTATLDGEWLDHCKDPLTELQRQVYRLLKELVLHELDEAFKVDGVRVYDPHREVPL